MNYDIYAASCFSKLLLISQWERYSDIFQISVQDPYFTLRKFAYLFLLKIYYCSFCSGFTITHLDLVVHLRFQLFTRNDAFLKNSDSVFWILSNSYCVYLHDRASIRHLSTICNSYQSIRILYDRYKLYPTDIRYHLYSSDLCYNY